MNNYRNRPKDNYIQLAEWRDLYTLTEEWKSNLEFELFEVEFLLNLVKTYFDQLLNEENLDELRELQRDLYHAENQSKLLIENCYTHLNHIAKIIDNPNKLSDSKFRNEHQVLEDDTSVFLMKHKTMKRTAFRMIKDILQNDAP